MNGRVTVFSLLLATTATHADAQQSPKLRTVWTLHTQPSDAVDSQAPMDPHGTRFNVRGVWTCRYTAPTTVTTPAGPRTFHRIGRELECDDGIGRVETSTSCDIDAPDTKAADVTVGLANDRAHKTTYVIQCRTEPVP